MKKIFCATFVAIFCAMALHAGNHQEIDKNNWYIMSGYGYSMMLGDMSGEGYSNVNSFIWQPNACWGFGLDYGMNYHNPVDYSFQENMNYQYTRRHNNFFVGPSVYWFPINIEKHRLHIGGSVNYFHTNDFNRYRDFDTNSQQYASERCEEIVINSVGLGASLGYAFKLDEHVELGLRFYTSWSQEEFHLMGLFNIGFGF